MPTMAISDQSMPPNSGVFSPVDRKRKSEELSGKEKRRRIEIQRKALPIYAVEGQLVESVQSNPTLVVVGETGSGKTTQLPQFLHNAGFCSDEKIIGITQPRRVAAVSVAKRVAEECGVRLGQRVGYSVRFDDMTSSQTKIKYMTDGILLREALLDPYLSKYSVIIVDEAHERTIHTDVLLGLLKKVQKTRCQKSCSEQSDGLAKRTSVAMPEKDCGSQPGSIFRKCPGVKLPPLKLIIMSASLDARSFSEFFNGAKTVHVSGRQFPIDTYYSFTAYSDYVDATITAILQIHLEEGPGDVLVFLTGQEEIEAVEGLVQERVKQLPECNKQLLIVPIFSSLPPDQQMKVFTPAPVGFRKVILATNIAETSVTIPGIKYVIDPGLVKARSYSPEKGIESLVTIPTSKAQALQRSGRAGREGPGKCFRLYPERIFEKLADSTTPEIKRCNLANVILQLKALGVDDITGFDFLDKPSRMAVVKSLEELYLLGALTEECKLSDPVGHQMARLPLDPIYSKALILASEFDCSEEMLITVAMLSVESIFYAPREKLEEARKAMKRFGSKEGDHVTMINIFREADEFLKSKVNSSKEKMLKSLKKWCKENFINSRSLRHARDIHSQIQRNVEHMGLRVASCGDNMEQFLKCLAASFSLKVASRLPGGMYRAIRNGQIVQIHPSSVLFRAKPMPDYIVFNEMVKTTQYYVRNVTRIEPLWLLELAPNCYASQD